MYKLYLLHSLSFSPSPTQFKRLPQIRLRTAHSASEAVRTEPPP